MLIYYVRQGITCLKLFLMIVDLSAHMSRPSMQIKPHRNKFNPGVPYTIQHFM